MRVITGCFVILLSYWVGQEVTEARLHGDDYALWSEGVEYGEKMCE